MNTARIVSLSNVVSSIALMLAVLTVACSAQQTEQEALDSLRAMMRDGKLPAESAVAPIESRWAGRKTGALAKLLRARFRFESGEYAGAGARQMRS